MALSQNPFYYKGAKYLDRERQPDDGSGIRQCAKFNLPRRTTNKSDRNIAACLATIPELGRYKLPMQEPHHEVFLLKELTANKREETPIGVKYLTHAQEIMLELTPQALQPAWFEKGWPRVDDVLSVIARQNRAKDPSFPAKLIGSTKGVVIDRWLPELVAAVFARFIMLNYAGPHCSTPEDYHRTYCIDFCTASIKTEAIKVEKGGRMILAIGIVSSCVELLLAGSFCDEFKDCVFEFYSAIGVGFTKAHSALLYKVVRRPTLNTDVPTFDWTVTVDENLLNVDVAMRRQGALPHWRVYKIAVTYEKALAFAPYINSAGTVYVPKKPGTMRTGRDLTSVFNTMSRARRVFAVDLLLIAKGFVIISDPTCAGDDATEEPHEFKALAYKVLGFPLRDAHVSNEIDFCSHFWPEGRIPVGQRIYKSAFNMLMNDPVEYDQFEAFCREYVHHDDFPALLPRIFAVRPRMKNMIEKMFNKIETVYGAVIKYQPYAKNGGKKKGPKSGGKAAGWTKNKAPVIIQRRAKVPRAPQVKKSGVKPHHVKAICSISDPFCPASRNAKWPDGTSGNTMTEQFRGNHTLTTLALGNAAITFCPTAPMGFMVGATSTTSTVTFQTAYTTYKAASMLATHGTNYRVVSFGVIIRAVASANTSAGLVTFGTTGTHMPVSSILTYGTELYDEVEIKAIQPGMEFAWISQPRGPAARDFVAQSIGTTPNASPFTSLVVEVTGCAASTNVLNFEWFMNLEFELATGAALSAATTRNPGKSPIAEAAVSHVHSSIGSFISGGIDTVEKEVAKAASSALNNAIGDPLGSLAALFGML